MVANTQLIVLPTMEVITHQLEVTRKISIHVAKNTILWSIPGLTFGKILTMFTNEKGNGRNPRRKGNHLRL